MVQCCHCEGKGIIRRPKTGKPICKECFFRVFEDEIHQTIVDTNLFKPGDKVAIGASGGKGNSTFSTILII
jgi:cytoplasmic tRNA 2-thiolation protein 1